MKDMKLIDVVLGVIDTAETAHDIGLGFDGCPCFRLSVAGIEIEGHCWRTGPREIEGCSLEYGGDGTVVTAQHVAEALKPKLDKMDWYGEWTVVGRK